MGNNKSIVFLHIPKSAGTSFRVAMQRALAPDEVVWHADKWRGEKLELDRIAQLIAAGETFKVIGGHFSYSRALAHLSPEHHFFATLRDPIQRSVSLFDFINRTPTHHLHAALSERSMLEALDTVPEFCRQITNLQCAYLSATHTPTYQSAVASIVENNIRVNTIDNPSLLLAESARLLGIETVPEVVERNAAPKTEAANSVAENQELIEKLSALNAEDLKLYRAVQDAFKSNGAHTYDSLKALSATKSPAAPRNRLGALRARLLRG